MDAPISELKRIKELQEQARNELTSGSFKEALAAVDEALAVEAQNTRSLDLKADILEKLGQDGEADALRQRVKQLKREAWQRKVEAEARGGHEVMGGATRHEKL